MQHVGLWFSATGKGSLYISLDKSHYFPGGLVTGSLHVTALEPLQCTEISVAVAGSEEVCWTTMRHASTVDKGSVSSNVHTGTLSSTVDKNNASSTMETHKTRRELLQKEVMFVFHNIPLQLLPGDHVYPFQFELPTDLPGTFDNNDDGGIKAKITYTIRGTLSLDSLFRRGLTDTKNLFVYTRPIGFIAPSVAEANEAIRFLCCFHYGTCHVQIALSKTLYAPGDILESHCSIRNLSAKDVSSVRYELVRLVHVAADDTRDRRSKTICSASFPGVAPGAQVVQTHSLQLLGHDGTVLYPSTRGEFVSCSYVLQVSCAVGWFASIRLDLPLAIAVP